LDIRLLAAIFTSIRTKFAILEDCVLDKLTYDEIVSISIIDLASALSISDLTNDEINLFTKENGDFIDYLMDLVNEYALQSKMLIGRLVSEGYTIKCENLTDDEVNELAVAYKEMNATIDKDKALRKLS
jgi:hypothetical protein